MGLPFSRERQLQGWRALQAMVERQRELAD
jgi:hypothetical protein